MKMKLPSDLKKRSLTAVALALAFVSCLYFIPPVLAWSVVVLIIAAEVFLFTIYRQNYPPGFKVLSLIIHVAFALLSWAYYMKVFPVPMAAFLTVLLCLWLIGLFLLSGKMPLKTINSTLSFNSFFIIYTGPIPFLALMWLQNPTEQLWFVVLLVICSATDLSAWILGKAFGRRKINKLSAFSPNKTLEGALGGMLSGGLGGIFCCYWLLDQLNLALCAACFVISVVCQVGDHLASLWKRIAQCKDSGSLLPGHGGFFDRFDGVYFSIPFWYTFYTLIM